MEMMTVSQKPAQKPNQQAGEWQRQKELVG